MSIRSDITIDWENSPRIITVASGSNEISVQDLIDTCMYEIALPANMDDDILLESSGKEYLVEDGSVKVGLTVTLNNAQIAFEARPGPEWVICDINGGNVVAVEDIYITPRVYISSRYPTAFINVDKTSSSSATLSDLEAIQYSSYQNAVWLDVDSSTAGTEYPAGTREYPVNNLVDAVAISYERGFDTIQVLTSTNLDSGTDIKGFKIIGRSDALTNIVIMPNAQCENIRISNCNVSGTLDGGTFIEDCSVGDITYVSGHFKECGMYGTVLLGGNENAVISDCYTNDQDSPLIVDMGDSGQNLSMPNYAGLATIKNLSSASEEIGIGLNAGMIILDSTISAGTIIISGVGMCQDDTTGTAYVNLDGLMSKQTITEISWDSVYVDIDEGESGTNFPLGTAGEPVDNLTDAVAIADSQGIKVFKIRGPVSLTQTFNNWTFMGIGSIFFDVIDLNNKSITGCKFESLSVSGTMTASGNQFVNCELNNTVGLDGLFIDSVLKGSLTMGGMGSVLTGQNLAMYGSTPGSPATLDMVGTGRVIRASLEGAVQFSNSAVGSVMEIGLNNGIVILDPTCAGGTAILTGVGNLINYSAMTVMDSLLNEDSITDYMLDAYLSTYTTSGTVGEALNDTVSNARLIPGAL